MWLQRRQAVPGLAPRWHDLTGEQPWPMWRLDMDDLYASLEAQARRAAASKRPAANGVQ